MLANHPLVTLTGPGGIGKTRLALGIAADALADYSDGVFLVALAPLTEPSQVVPAIARTLGVRDRSGGSLLSQVASALQRK
jgi:predicted ATPase